MDEIIYAVPIDENIVNFMAQLQEEQQADVIIATPIREVEHGEPVTIGRLKKVQKQLRMENGPSYLLP